MSAPVTRVAIVTGAARGIGQAIALRLAREGLDVVVNDLPSQAEALENLVAKIHAEKRRSIAILGDASQENDVQNLVDTTVAELGGLDVMIANAGIGRTAPLISTSLDQWDLVQSTNVRSAFLCYKAAAIQMIKQGRGGRIIGACSVAGKQGFPEWSAYSASKFAVRALTQSAAIELQEHGITVNAYAPGIVNTQIFDEIAEHRTKQGLGQLGLDAAWKILSVEDVAGLVAYLVREESRFVTGQAMNINGGMCFD